MTDYIKIKSDHIYRIKHSNKKNYNNWIEYKKSINNWRQTKKYILGKWYCKKNNLMYLFFEQKYSIFSNNSIKEAGKFRLVRNNEKGRIELYLKPYTERKYNKFKVIHIKSNTKLKMNGEWYIKQIE